MKLKNFIYGFLLAIFAISCNEPIIETEALPQEQPQVIQLKAAVIGAKYYVAKTGNDSNSGTLSSPFFTIQKGLDIAKAGDTVFVKTGIYPEYVRFKNSGTSGKPIVLSKYSSNLVTIDAGFTRVYCIYSIDQNYLVVDGINVKNATNYNVLLSGCRNVVLKNMSSICPVTASPIRQNFKIIGNATNWSNGIILQSLTSVGGFYGIWLTGKVSNVKVTNCEVSYASTTGLEINLDNVQIPSTLQLSNRPRSIVVDNVYSHHNSVQGISTRIASNITIRNCRSAYNGATGIQIEAYTDTTIIENNLCEYGSRAYTYETGIWIFNSTNSIVRRNILKNNQTGLRVSKMTNFVAYNNLIINNNYSPGGTNQSTSGADFSESTGTFFNNTLYGNCASNSKLGSIHVFPLSIEVGITKPSNIIIKNNIVMNSGSTKDMDFDQSEGVIISDYNIIFNAKRAVNIQIGTNNYTWSAYKTKSKQDSNSKNANPLFVSQEILNYKLQSTSPAINAAIAVGVYSDYLFKTRNGLPDIGAYEF